MHYRPSTNVSSSVRVFWRSLFVRFQQCPKLSDVNRCVHDLAIFTFVHYDIIPTGITISHLPTTTHRNFQDGKNDTAKNKRHEL